MDTNLGQLAITQKQMRRLSELKNDLFLGFGGIDDSIIVVSARSLTPEEIDGLKESILLLPDEYPTSYYENAFSFKVLMGYLNQTMAAESIITLSPYTGAMQSFCDWKNWEGIKAFLDGLVASEIATAEEVSQIIAAFAEQGIVIE